MKRFLVSALLGIAVLAMAIAPPARAGDFYGALAVSADPHEWEDFPEVFGIRGAAGMALAEKIRVEFEYTWTDLGNDSLIASGYYDFGALLGATPFVGAGAGAELRGIDIERGIGHLAGGLSYPVTDRIAGTVAYSYRFELKGFEEVDQAVMLGVRIGF